MFRQPGLFGRLLLIAYCFAGDSVPGGGLVLGRGAARFRVVWIGEVRKVRGNIVERKVGF